MSATAAIGKLEAWSDRLNPILVREVQQAVKGRVFMLTVLAALLVEVFIALAVADDVARGHGSGRNAFDAGLATLAPLLLFVVPMQAYQSMIGELRGGMIEQLLLSELRPLRIVAGKLGAAMVQFTIYLSVAAPLLTTSYVLRGVDLPTILFCLAFAMLFCLGATAFAIAAALQGTLPSMRPLAMIGMAFGLGTASLSMVGYIGSGECLRDVSWLLRSSELWPVASAVALGTLAAIALLALIAQAYLAHTFENRSTGFRVFLFVVPLAWFGWMYLVEGGTPSPEFVGVSSFLLALFGTFVALFMVTELRDLSPRVRAHVPKQPLVALLVAPLLPGRDRGLLCMVGYVALVGALTWLSWSPRTGSFFRFDEAMVRGGAMIAAYAFAYLTLVRLARSVLPEQVLFNHGARFAAPLLVLVGCLLPLLYDGLLAGGVDDWHIGHLLNPFWTIAEFSDQAGDTAVQVSLVVCAVLLVLQALPLGRGVLEVVTAAAERRRREAVRGGE